MNPHGITTLEKAALLTTGAAAAYQTLLWSLGVDTAAPPEWLWALRSVFAVLSFVAFDLVLVAIVIAQRAYGVSWAGLLALAGAAVVSAAIALDVAKVYPTPALHAAPAVVLLLFALHLICSPRTSAAEAAAGSTLEAADTAAPAAEAAAIVNNLQVNLAVPADLPPNVKAFIAAHAARLPGYSQAMLAAELGTSVDTIRRALAASLPDEVSA